MKRTLAGCSLLVALAACGGGDGGERPSQQEVADALRDADNPAGQAFAAGDTSDAVIDCVATALHGSDLSDEALQAVVDGDEDYDGSGEDEEALTGLTEDITACLTG